MSKVTYLNRHYCIVMEKYIIVTFLYCSCTLKSRIPKITFAKDIICILLTLRSCFDNKHKLYKVQICILATTPRIPNRVLTFELWLLDQIWNEGKINFLIFAKSFWSLGYNFRKRNGTERLARNKQTALKLEHRSFNQWNCPDWPCCFLIG